MLKMATRALCFTAAYLAILSALDEILGGGLQRSDMIVLGARPSLGKTSLALGIARNAAVDHGACVALFSLRWPGTPW